MAWPRRMNAAAAGTDRRVVVRTTGFDECLKSVFRNEFAQAPTKPKQPARVTAHEMIAGAVRQSEPLLSVSLHIRRVDIQRQRFRSASVTSLLQLFDTGRDVDRGQVFIRMLSSEGATTRSPESITLV